MAPISSKLLVLLPHLIESAALFAVDPQLNSLLLLESNAELMVSLIEILCRLSDQQPFQDIFIQNKGKLLVSVCLNLIKTSEVEADLIVDDPSEFVNMAIDSCDKQKSETVKTQACKLFEAMCDNVDGSTTFVAHFCCNAINRVYGRATTEESFWGMETDAFLTRTDPEFIVDACLVALTVISYILPERKDLTYIFTEAMDLNIGHLLERKPILPHYTNIQIAKAVIVRSRLSLLIGYYGDLLFIGNDEAFKKATSFLFESMANQEGPEKVVCL